MFGGRGLEKSIRSICPKEAGGSSAGHTEKVDGVTTGDRPEVRGNDPSHVRSAMGAPSTRVWAKNGAACAPHGAEIDGAPHGVAGAACGAGHGVGGVALIVSAEPSLLSAEPFVEPAS